MTSNSAVDKELASLKRKLDSAVSSRANIENDLTHQSSLFSEFIIKLSQVAKGTDTALDNKLAKLRTLFTKSAPIESIEELINDISQSLQQYSRKNDHEIRELQEKFISGGHSLQKIKGLPDDLRRQLRVLLKDNQEAKSTLPQYIPILSQLLSYYQYALKQGNVSNDHVVSVTNDAASSTSGTASADKARVIKRFEEYLAKITISRQYQAQLKKIKAELSDNMPRQKLFASFLAAFDVISLDLQRERNTAKIFLSTLSETLATVQSAVTTTVKSQELAQNKLQALNDKMQGQINDMADDLDKANSLVDIKVDINAKLQAIAKTLEEKTSFEHSQQALFSEQLKTMQERVIKLEEQSKVFEKRIQEQQEKSLQDALTKLNNRAAFDEHFAKETARCQHKNIPLAIVVADLDNFKRINDTYGHTAGDKTLQVLANTFKKHIEKHAFVARYGGEEFVFVFTGIDKDELIHILNLLRKTVSKLPFKFKNNKVSMTLSIGATHVMQGDNVHIAFERADTALYQAKENGKNQVIYLDQ